MIIFKEVNIDCMYYVYTRALLLILTNNIQSSKKDWSAYHCLYAYLHFTVITIGIQDDEVPEYDEVLVVQLMDPLGGAVLGSQNIVNVVILANDYVAGVVGLASSSYIAKEGRIMSSQYKLYSGEPIIMIHLVYNINYTWNQLDMEVYSDVAIYISMEQQSQEEILPISVMTQLLRSTFMHSSFFVFVNAHWRCDHLV